MHTIEEGMLVQFHFKMYTPDGECLADTEDKPMTYIHGMMGTEPPALGAHLEGKHIGYQSRFTIPNAFGERLPPEQARTQIPVEQLGEDIQKGMMFAASVGDKEIPMMVMEVRNGMADILMGHPLAGFDITFDVEILEVRPATQDDVAAIQQELGLS